MTIHRMTANFGRLAGETLTLTPGLNLIAAPNESGKSTWCAFLRAMLYGIPTSQRDKAGFLAEKNRYQPWSGAPLEGILELTWQGRDITLRRFAKGAVPFGGFEAVYTGTGEVVPGLTGENCGETILGVGREVFERTAFVGQAGAQFDGAPELETRIAALASSGEEDVSYSETQRRLKDWRNGIMANKAVGALPKKQQELQEIEELLGRLESAERRSCEARIQIEALSQKRTVLEGERGYYAALRDADKRERYEAAKAALLEAQRDEKALRGELARYGTMPDMETLRNAQGELAFVTTLETALKGAVIESGAAETAAREARTAAADPLFGELTPDELKRKIETEKLAPPPLKRSPLRIAGWILCALSVLGLAVWAILKFAMELALAPAIPVICGVVAAGSLVLALLSKGKLQPSAMLQQYGVADFEELEVKAAAFGENWNLMVEAERQSELLSGRVAEYTRQREEALQKLRDFAKPFAPDATDAVSLSVALSRALMLEDKLEKAAARTASAAQVWGAVSADGEPVAADVTGTPPPHSAEETERLLTETAGELRRLTDTLAMAQGEKNTLGDPAALGTRALALEEELEKLRGDYDALTAALECLEAANGALQARFSPDLNRRAGEIFQKLTGEKYQGVTLNRDFEASATEAGGLIPRRVLSLSQGTADQLYLAVRLAVCDLVLSADDPSPLVLDDALVTFDDSRMAAALRYLQTLAEARQILLFTCQSREGEILTCNAGEKNV
ncbi:MAG: AAA family ATPase [Oscillospiraceae bacterium]